jgi:RimJ/RimL family protein N-acetyltransferase
MIEQVRLRDGTDAFVLPLQRTDKATLVAEFETLAPESRRGRFLSAVTHLTDSMLEHLVDDVDGIDHVALVLCVETSPDVYDPVALGRMVRYTDVPDAADVAVTVKDAWHGRGVATALLEVLVRERPVGVDRIVTEVFTDNRASLLMLDRLGHATVEDLGFGVSEVVVDLAPLATSATPGDVDASPDTKVRGSARAGVVEKRTSQLRDHPRRHTLRTRDQVCPWFN